jgi:predicted dehydrogenase
MTEALPSPRDNTGKQNAFPGRRRFLQSAIGAGLTWGVTARGKAVGQSKSERRKTRVGLIGTDGHIGVLLGSIPRLPDVELTAFAKSLPEDDVAGVSRYPAFTESTRVYDHFEPMLEKEELISDPDGARDLELPGSVDFFRDFLAELAGEGQHLISQEDAFRMTEVVLLARSAAETGKWIEIDT